MRVLTRSSRRGVASTLFALALLPSPAGVAAAPSCSARSGPTVPVVVELYTSEGCDSCPPADRWLGTLKGRTDVVPLAFHVDYWDSRDWKDRFAQPKFTRRQNAALRSSGARFAYTPQVVVDGRDEPGWSRIPASTLQARTPATVDMTLAQDPTGLALTLAPRAGAPAELEGYVAVVDDGMQTHVDGGENRGATLRQDSVVRELLPWNLAGAEPATLRFASRTTPEPGATRHWVAVATNGAYGPPVQAVTLACTP
ncbi:DUF1223 domain-containing protein [Scleromatobacter humisilvae]|uniref:DUF1223 domain-containing protein n=1 Tax=Scleromatobacter humisilvae TaxID=2897159 RepID=A0A9X1YK16_9BURK|nr:DUF1223 domain-containing protein [Scleromatobacter humisilvae]MCK9687939.1 DUF1223 domain-containing protein [Scleromatobacter humisilvae]